MCLFLWRKNDDRSVGLVCILCPAAKWSYQRSSSCAVRPTNPDGGGHRKTTVRSSSSGSRFPAKRKLVFLDLRVFTNTYFQLHLLRRTHKEDAKVAAQTIQNVFKLRRIQARFQYTILHKSALFSETFDKHFIFNNFKLLICLLNRKTARHMKMHRGRFYWIQLKISRMNAKVSGPALNFVDIFYIVYKQREFTW